MAEERVNLGQPFTQGQAAVAVLVHLVAVQGDGVFEHVGELGHLGSGPVNGGADVDAAAFQTRPHCGAVDAMSDFVVLPSQVVHALGHQAGHGTGRLGLSIEQGLSL